MRIVIATGIYPPQIGGPAQYAKNLAEEFIKKGHRVKILTYRLEKHLPSGVRHFYFFAKLIFALWRVDFILALDTFSVGLPAVLAARLVGKKIMIRTGGDFLWEGYVERTGHLVLLREFYENVRGGSVRLNFKEKAIFGLTKWVIHKAQMIVFSTEWQRDIWSKPYQLSRQKTKIIENYYG
ncbi:glycosyltransferase [Candidatus Nomurabacteria bacterium]|nr:glycosyltransferase [Candidatus Nomurabacteria bacterium]